MENIEQPSKALQQQTRTDQRNERQRNFGDDQSVVHAMASRRADSLPSLLQNAIEVAHPRAQRGE